CEPMRIANRSQGIPQRAPRRERKSRGGPAGSRCARQQDQPVQAKGGDKEMTWQNDPPRVNSPLALKPNWILRSLHQNCARPSPQRENGETVQSDLTAEVGRLSTAASRTISEFCWRR